MKIIAKAKSENRRKNQGVYYEIHHILPKSLYPKWTKRKTNKVLLTAKEHYFCHKLLLKIFPHSSEMGLAYSYLTHDKRHKVSMRDYQRAKELLSKMATERLLKHPKGQWKKGNVPWNKGLSFKRSSNKSQAPKKYYNKHYNYYIKHDPEEAFKNRSIAQKRRYEREEERLKDAERTRRWMSALTDEERKKRAEQIRQTCIKNRINCKQVICIETGETFPSAKDAMRKYGGHIAEAANGSRKMAAGYHWKYV